MDLRKELIDFGNYLFDEPEVMVSTDDVPGLVDEYLESINSHHDKGGTLGNNEHEEKYLKPDWCTAKADCYDHMCKEHICGYDKRRL
jgi:hypothetical protein